MRRNEVILQSFQRREIHLPGCLLDWILLEDHRTHIQRGEETLWRNIC